MPFLLVNLLGGINMHDFMKKIAYCVAASLIALFGIIGITTSASAKTNTSSAQISNWKAHDPIHAKHISSGIKLFTFASIYSPSQIKQAYGIDKLNKTGAGATIALVEAYGSPTIKNDLKTFNERFDLPNTNINVVYPSGKPKTDGGWALETALDVEWAHALAPKANIMVVSAKSASINDLLKAEDYATNHGATIVSNSWGGSEFSSETSYDNHFNHSGVTYLASSGDNGQGSSWPASSPNVVSVGGTTLTVKSTGEYGSETAWSGSGGELSQYEGRPTYQSNWTSILGSKRGIPDVAFDADPNTGVYVYSSTAENGQTGWFQVGGTSFSAPAWGALIALANEGRTQSLSSKDVLKTIYSTAGKTGSKGYKTNFHDIVSGSNGYTANAGYDVVTGIGSPIANKFITTLNDK